MGNPLESAGAAGSNISLSCQTVAKRVRTGAARHPSAAGDRVLLRGFSDEDAPELIGRPDGEPADVVDGTMLKRPISPKELGRALLIACGKLSPEERAAHLAVAP